MLSDYQAKLPKVECTDKRFMDSIAELYRRDVISPKKTMDEAIGQLDMDISAVPEPDLHRVLTLYFPHLNYKKESLRAYRVAKNFKSKIFYDYYEERFLDKSAVYIIMDQDAEIFTSNCDLLDLYIQIIRGVDEADIKSRTNFYKHYLNCMYMFNEAYSSLK